RQPWGVKLEVQNAPASAFVDGEMIRGIKEHLFAVLRDVVFISNEIIASGRFDLKNSASITNAVFHVLRNARLLDYKARPNLVVCWGGHSIGDLEYQYTKRVGYELGLRGLDVCTGCGPGAMKGPMKGATSRFPSCSPGRATPRRTSSRSAASSPARSGRRRSSASPSSSTIRRKSPGAWCAAWTRCGNSAAATATRIISTGCCRSSPSFSGLSR